MFVCPPVVKHPNPKAPSTAARRYWFSIICLAKVSLLFLFPQSSRSQGFNWPDNQLLPTFAQPAAVIDCIDVSSASSAEVNLFASVEGIVNRSQPRIACTSAGDGEGEFTWINLCNLPTNLITGYNAILKYRTNFTGLVVTDTNEPDTVNLATTMAGVNNELICDPSLLATLTNSPYSLPVTHDLRGQFSTKYQVYNYLYANYWPSCTHRFIAGMETNVAGELREYLVALKAATVWLDPGPANIADQVALAQFVSNMTPVHGVYGGWWPSEGNGLGWIAQYGIPVLASDFLCNASLYSGVARTIHVPPVPPPPPLQNKVYVSLILSDGDNIQYMQHVMKMRWGDPARGSIPIGWTVTSLAADAAPVMFDYYWSTGTKNDCLISGPCGAGYTHMENWSAANLGAFAQVANPYLQRTGLRVITVWDQVTTGIAQAFATNCPSLLGLTDQSGGHYTSVNDGLCIIGLSPGYSSTTNDIINNITNAAKNWNGTAPFFIAAQADTWNLTPSDLRTIASALDPNEYVLVRPDHLFMLFNRLSGPPTAVTAAQSQFTSTGVTLRGSVVPHATNAVAWFEWGTNAAYGSKTIVTNVTGNAAVMMSANIGGLLPQVIYHFRIAASNALGVAYGADRQFTLGGRLKTWGAGGSGQTNPPPGLTNVTAIACGDSHALAVKSDGTVVAWGLDSAGQTNVPPGLANVVQVSGGFAHSIALTAGGAVAAWGNNDYGQTNVPATLTNAVQIAAGAYHNIALKADGTVTAWGFNGYGQTNIPSGLSNVTAVAAGYGHNLALNADGTVTAWGYNNSGQTNVPAGLNNVVAIAAGEYNSMALRADGLSPLNLHPASRWVADSLVGIDGSSVSNWLDIVAGAAATQSAAAQQPSLYSNVLNGHKTVRFNSSNSQYLTVPAASSPISGASDFTLVVVFQTSSPGDNSSSFFQNTGLLGAEQPGVVQDWALCINGSELGAGLGAGSSACNADVSLYGGTVTDGKPHIATYVRSGSSLSLYVDGILLLAQGSLCTSARGNYDFQIGAMTTSSHFLSGDIAEIQLYSRGLSPAEVSSENAALASTYGLSGAAGAPVNRWVADSLSGANGSSVSNWTDVLAAKSATQATLSRRPQLYSNVLNGHNTVRFSSAFSQYLTVAAPDSPISGAGSFTMVVVFRTSTLGASSSSFYQNTGLLGAEQPGVVADWALCLNGTQAGAGLGGGASGCGADLSLYGGNVTDGKPHIAMYVRSGESVSLYVDAVNVVTQSSLCTLARGDYPFQIGAMTPGTLCFNGDIAEIDLYNRSLNSSEIMSVNQVLSATYGVNTGIAGSVVVWGDNTYGQAVPPMSFTNVVAGACGNAFNLVLSANDRLTSWGLDSSGQTNAPNGLTNIVALAGGTGFSLAIADQTPQVNNFATSGFVNHDLTLTLPGSDPDDLPFNFSIATLPLSGTLYQYSNGTRGDPISATNTLVADAAGHLIFAPAQNATGNPYDSFTFLAEDAQYSSGSAQAFVNIGLPAPPQFTSALWNPSNSAAPDFQLNFNGSSNATYSVLVSTDLIDWTLLGIGAESTPGQYQFIDATVTNWPQRFYRTSAP